MNKGKNVKVKTKTQTETGGTKRFLVFAREQAHSTTAQGEESNCM